MPMPVQKPGRSKQDYETPDDLLAAVKARLGIKEFVFDFAASEENKKAPSCWTEEDDALSYGSWGWYGVCRPSNWGWLNPPFKNIGKWAEACAATIAHGTRIAMVVPASVGANWFRDHVFGREGVTVLFLNPRPSFDGQHAFPKDCMVILWDGQSTEPFAIEVWQWKETA